MTGCCVGQVQAFKNFVAECQTIYACALTLDVDRAPEQTELDITLNKLDEHLTMLAHKLIAFKEGLAGDIKKLVG